MYQHERSLVQKYINRPFVIVGVNTDEKTALKKIIADNKLTWNSWADGSPSGPICKQWNVHSFPTMFLIDANGKLRKRNLAPMELDNAIEELVSEAEGNRQKPLR